MMYETSLYFKLDCVEDKKTFSEEIRGLNRAMKGDVLIVSIKHVSKVNTCLAEPKWEYEVCVKSKKRLTKKQRNNLKALIIYAIMKSQGDFSWVEFLPKTIQDIMGIGEEEKMMKKLTIKDLKVGDLVELRDDLENNKQYGEMSFVDGMKYKGFRKITRFDYYDIPTFNIENMESMYNYTPEMIAEVKRSTKYEIVYKYKKPALDEAEKRYLSAVIKPFRDKIDHIGKNLSFGYDDAEYIYIAFTSEETMRFRHFKKGTMYKGMELNKNYTLEELGL